MLTTHFDLVSGPFWAPGGPNRARFGPKCPFWVPRRSSEGPGRPDLVPTAPDWSAWVGLMPTTHFDLVLGPFWVPGGAKKGYLAPVPKFPRPNFVMDIFCFKYRLLGCPEHRSGIPCSSSTVIAAVIYYISQQFICWDFVGMTIQDPKIVGMDPNSYHPKPRPTTLRIFWIQYNFNTKKKIVWILFQICYTNLSH